MPESETTRRLPTVFLDEENKTDEAREKFTEIEECIYSNKSLGSSDQNETMSCDCFEDWDPDTEQNIACGEDSDCINRVTSVECVNKQCNCGKDCRNQRFQKKQYSLVSVFQTEKKGYGLRADQDISESGFVYEYIGEVIDESTFRKRMAAYDSKNFKHFYFMMLKKDSFIDATIKGSLARFCNHSCNPNAYVDKWVVGDKLRMGIFAKRSIQKGEEITFDYNVDRYGAQSQPCYCGEPNCIKWMGGKTQTDAALLLPDGISEALGVTSKQERQWLKHNKHLRPKQQDDTSLINEEFVKSIEVSALSDRDVSKVIGSLMRSQEFYIVEKLVERIYLTDDSIVHSLIIRFHGYKTLSKVINDYKDNVLIVRMILTILSKWPRVTRNKISSSQIEDIVKELNHSTQDGEIKQLSSALLEEWSKLQMAYRIPKNEKKSSSPALYERGGRSLDPENSATPIDEPLPEGWEMGFDPNTQKNYFFNRELNVSRWDRPPAPAPTPPRGPPKGPKSLHFDTKRQPKRSFQDDDLTRREEERLKKEKEEQFKEMQEKERKLQELILESQKEAEHKIQLKEQMEKERREKRKQKEKLKHKKMTSKSSISSSSRSADRNFEKQWTTLFAKYIPNLIKKYEKDIGRDNIKGCARELVKTLVQKELKRNSDPPEELDHHKLKKLKEFSRNFMEKFMTKYEEKQANKKRNNEDSETPDYESKKNKTDATEH